MPKSSIAIVSRTADPSNELALPADGSQDPVVRYIANALHTPKSRATALESLKRIGRALGRDWRTIRWELLTVEEMTVLDERLRNARFPRRDGARERLSPVTVKLTRSVLRGVLQAAFDLGRLDADTLARLTRFSKIRAKRIPAGRMLTDEEIDRLKTHLGTLAAPYREFVGAFLAVLLVGLRRAEVANLSVDALEGRTLRFIGKGDKERAVPMPSWG